MSEENDISNLQQLLDQICEAADDQDDVSINDILGSVGRRSFGPVLLVPGIIGASPLSGIPGMPTVIGVMVLLVAGQLLIGRDKFWMPKFVLRRSVSRKRLVKAVKVMRPVARFVDRIVKPRLTVFTCGVSVYVIAALCLALSLTAPLLELVPFAITGVGAAVSVFGLALISNDGILALVACAFCIASAIVMGMTLS